jgi:hypothetical protein
MKFGRFLIVVLVCLVGVAAVADDEKDKEKERTEIREMSRETLVRLYKVEPPAKVAIKKAYGYAVFSNTGVKILFGGSGRGEGVAINNQTKAETFMKMLEVQAGLGLRLLTASVRSKTGWTSSGSISRTAETTPKAGQTRHKTAEPRRAASGEIRGTLVLGGIKQGRQKTI